MGRADIGIAVGTQNRRRLVIGQDKQNIMTPGGRHHGPSQDSRQASDTSKDTTQHPGNGVGLTSSGLMAVIHSGGPLGGAKAQ